jgi:predicted membrane channel-forming protein YqfA (hemolysin III family)
MSYQPMPPAPQGGPPPGAPGPRTAPSTVQNAVRLMFAIAALGIIGIIIVFTDKSALRKAIRDANSSYSTSQLNDAVNTAVAVAAVIAVILVVLYILLALQVRKGKNWARIVTWVLAGLGALGAISNLAQPQAALTKVIAVIELVLYVLLIVFLAMRPSNDYFRKPTYRY